MWRRWFLGGLSVVCGCATVAETPAAPPSPPPAQTALGTPDAGPPTDAPKLGLPLSLDPKSSIVIREVSAEDWIVETRRLIGKRQSVDPAQVQISPHLGRAAFVRALPPVRKAGRSTGTRAAATRRYQIVVTDTEGRQKGLFVPMSARGSDEPPQGFDFLSESSLIYEVVPARRPDVEIGPRAHPVAGPAGSPGEHERRLFVIQPLAKNKRPIRCEGIGFAWSPLHDHIAFIEGSAPKNAVVMDGVERFPRKGTSSIAGPLSWSRDGLGLAFIEARPSGPMRLVLLSALDKPTPPTTWDLPNTVPADGAQVVWSGGGKLSVVASPLHTSFSALVDPKAATKRTR